MTSVAWRPYSLLSLTYRGYFNLKKKINNNYLWYQLKRIQSKLFIWIRLWKQTKSEQCTTGSEMCIKLIWFNVCLKHKPHHLTFRWWVDLILSPCIHSVPLFSFPRSSFAPSVNWLVLSSITGSHYTHSCCLVSESLFTRHTALRLWTQHTQTAAVCVEKWFTSSHIRHQRAWLKSAWNRAG